MQSMDGSRSASRRLKDRLAWLLRPANSLLRSPCSSSSTSTVTTTTTVATTISISSSSSSTTTAALPARAEPFSTALDLLRQPPPPEHKKSRRSSSTHHARRRHLKNVDGKGVMRKLASNPYGFTTDEEDGTDSGDDTEAFLSSRSLVSSDSSGFYTPNKQLPKYKAHDIQRRQRQQKPRRRRRRAPSCMEACSVRDGEAGFRPLVTTAEEKLRKGLAVVKRSTDPYSDFRESMVEMIVERQVFGEAELERLLASYLSLNASRLHPVILQAFSDIWVVLRGC